MQMNSVNSTIRRPWRLWWRKRVFVLAQQRQMVYAKYCRVSSVPLTPVWPTISTSNSPSTVFPLNLSVIYIGTITSVNLGDKFVFVYFLFKFILCSFFEICTESPVTMKFCALCGEIIHGEVYTRKEASLIDGSDPCGIYSHNVHSNVRAWKKQYKVTWHSYLMHRRLHKGEGTLVRYLHPRRGR